jgi:putative nucleotidyltransferase with HDIG domain
MIDLDALLRGVDALPVSPYPLPELFKALSDPNTDMGRVVEIIQYDPALTAKLLQLCNSAFFGRGRPANEVSEAVARLGFQTIYRVVASLKSPQLFRPSAKGYGIDPQAIWKHSAVAALAAQFMADDFGEDSGVLFTAGLLHDVGKVILAQKFKEQYQRALQVSREQQKPLSQVEIELFGASHADVGARLLELWGFSPELVTSVRFHHAPQQAKAAERFPAIVQVASAFSHTHYPSPGEEGLPFDAHSGLSIFGWTTEDLGKYSSRLDQNMALFKAMMQMGVSA